MALNTTATYTATNTNQYKWKGSFTQEDPGGGAAVTHNHGENINWEGTTYSKNDVILAQNGVSETLRAEIMEHLIAVGSTVIEQHVV